MVCISYCLLHSKPASETEHVGVCVSVPPEGGVVLVELDARQRRDAWIVGHALGLGPLAIEQHELLDLERNVLHCDGVLRVEHCTKNSLVRWLARAGLRRQEQQRTAHGYNTTVSAGSKVGKSGNSCMVTWPGASIKAWTAVLLLTCSVG